LTFIDEISHFLRRHQTTHALLAGVLDVPPPGNLLVAGSVRAKGSICITGE
jgi:hypothetical protein